VTASVVLALLGAAGVAARGFGGTESRRPQSSRLPPATARVERTTLTQTERISGTLGYGKPTVLVARESAVGNGGDGGGGASPSPSHTPGMSPSPIPTTNTVTWLPPLGAVVRPGQPMFKVDNRDVVLVAGNIPPYRVLAVGASGPDVRQLERNLWSFGYRGFTADDVFTSSTTTAVKRFQRDLGWPQTG
jgi:hypothetical protein